MNTINELDAALQAMEAVSLTSLLHTLYAVIGTAIVADGIKKYIKLAKGMNIEEDKLPTSVTLILVTVLGVLASFFVQNPVIDTWWKRVGIAMVIPITAVSVYKPIIKAFLELFPAIISRIKR